MRQFTLYLQLRASCALCWPLHCCSTPALAHVWESGHSTSGCVYEKCVRAHTKKVQGMSSMHLQQGCTCAQTLTFCWARAWFTTGARWMFALAFLSAHSEPVIAGCSRKAWRLLLATARRQMANTSCRRKVKSEWKSALINAQVSYQETEWLILTCERHMWGMFLVYVMFSPVL